MARPSRGSRRAGAADCTARENHGSGQSAGDRDGDRSASAIRFRAMRYVAGSTSVATTRRPSRAAARVALPLPLNGSRIRLPGGVRVEKNQRYADSGCSQGWNLRLNGYSTQVSTHGRVLRGLPFENTRMSR